MKALKNIQEYLGELWTFVQETFKIQGGGDFITIEVFAPVLGDWMDLIRFVKGVVIQIYIYANADKSHR